MNEFLLSLTKKELEMLKDFANFYLDCYETREEHKIILKKIEELLNRDK